jgi:hypothetical protein
MDQNRFGKIMAKFWQTPREANAGAGFDEE